MELKYISCDVDLTVHKDLHRQTLECVYVPHRWVPHSLAGKLPSIVNSGSPKNKGLSALMQLLRSLKPLVAPVGHVGIRYAASELHTFPREDPGMSRHDRGHGSDRGHRVDFGTQRSTGQRRILFWMSKGYFKYIPRGSASCGSVESTENMKKKALETCKCYHRDVVNLQKRKKTHPRGKPPSPFYFVLLMTI